MKQQIDVSRITRESGEVFYLLPSGFKDTWIQVLESPTELAVRHIDAVELAELLAEVGDGPLY